MMKFAALCLLFAVACSEYCYDEGVKMTAFTYGEGDNQENLMSMIPAEDKAFSNTTVKKCADKTVCFQYTVSATATIPQFDEAFEPQKDASNNTIYTTGTMMFVAQGCMDETLSTNSSVAESICVVWRASLEKEFNTNELAGMFTNFSTTCGTPSKCGATCVDAKDIKSNAVGLGVGALLLTFLYMF